MQQQFAGRKYPTLADYIHAVDVALDARIGMKSADLPDYDFDLAYRMGDSVSSTATRVIRQAKEF